MRWLLIPTRTIDWSVAMSLPLGLMASLLLIVVSAMMSVNSGSSTVSGIRSVAPGFLLLGVWAGGLGLQAMAAQFWLGRRRKLVPSNDESMVAEIVTLTIGGIWAAVPPDVTIPEADDPEADDPEADDPEADEFDPHSAVTADAVTGDPQPKRNQPKRNQPNHNQPNHNHPALSGASRMIVMWATVLILLGTAAFVCLLADMKLDSSVDRPWVAAAWMFCLQGVWQLLPLPQSLGRVGWSVIIAWFTPTAAISATDGLSPVASADGGTSPSDVAELRDARIGPDSVMCTRRARWWMIGFAFVALGIGVMVIQTAGFSTEGGGEPLPVFAGVVLLSLWLFASSRNEDLFAIQLTISENGEVGRLHSLLKWRSTLRNLKALKSQRSRTKQLQAALARERSEASDASRVDEILQRLHEKGPDSLSEEERGLLKRVSEAIRHQRQRDQSAD